MNRHFFWVLALTSSLAWADGTLKDVKGEVKVDGKVAVAGSEVLSGASVKTGPAARATIRFDDGQVIVLGANTEFKVRQYAYSKADSSKDNIVLDLFRGTLRAISGALGHRNPNKFALYTPTATAGIRGTDFLSIVTEFKGQDGVVRQQVTFAVKNGKITVSTKAGSLTLGQGQAVVTSPSGAITQVPIGSLPAELQELANLNVVDIAGTNTAASITGSGAGTGAGAAVVAVPVVAVAGAVAGVVAATSDDSTVTGHHGSAPGHTTSHHGN